jgi:hypothetical protein
MEHPESSTVSSICADPFLHHDAADQVDVSELDVARINRARRRQVLCPQRAVATRTGGAAGRGATPWRGFIAHVFTVAAMSSTM